MGLMDLLLLALVGSYCVYLLIPKKKKCTGNCANCGGCSRK